MGTYALKSSKKQEICEGQVERKRKEVILLESTKGNSYSSDDRYFEPLGTGGGKRAKRREIIDRII